MSSLPYYNEAGPGQHNSDNYHYSQAVKVGNVVKCAGQGGWDSTGKLDASNAKGQVELAFQNVDNVLQAAGLRGWEDVYSIRSYHVDMDASFQAFVDKLSSRIPGHKPIWTCIGVPRLALPDMLIEVEVEAYAGGK